MSVVNDVLKNLDERKSIETSAGLNSLYFQNSNEQSKWLWVGLGVSLAMSTILLILLLKPEVFELKSDSEQVVLPNDLFMLENESPTQKETSHPIKEIVTVTDPVVIKQDKVVNFPIQKNLDSKSSDNEIVKKTQESKATETVMSAIKKGDMDKVKSTFSTASKNIQDEVQWRMLLKENPQLVWPKIKQKYPDYLTQPRLLALSAQGQQRAGDHNSAVQLYKKLIPLEPSDGRWRAGLAISLESLGDTDNAKKLYKIALGMNNLPFSLMRFTQQRLEKLRN